MDRRISPLSIALAAAAAGRVGFCPSDSTKTYKVVGVTEYPNIAVASDPTDYVTRSPFCGATACATAKLTSAAATVQGTPVNYTLATVQSSLEFSQAAPFSIQITQAASGKAFNSTFMLEYEEVR